MTIQHIQKFFFCLFLSFFLYSCSSKGSPGPPADLEGEKEQTASLEEPIVDNSPPTPLPIEVGDNNDPEIFKIPEQKEFLKGLDSKNMEIQQLNAKIKKLESEINYYSDELRAIKAKTQVWENPYSIFSKEIILNNGNTLYGKIVYQDAEFVKIETLIGDIVVSRNEIVRVVENVQPKEELDIQNKKAEEPTPGNTLIETRKKEQTANCVVIGSINESRDGSSNTILSGEIKNIGTERADFVKVVFTFRKNWQGETKTLAAFVKGSYTKFNKTGLTSDSSVFPDASAPFHLVVPKDFEPYIAYTYTVDWEQYATN
ncbi:MAG: hypothetical protein CBD58_02610 [bacterium TMED198]|nr:MAG: hypothetical protein CBD58_02610 [bacterium TMED198]|tara:strand:+ start:123 stop:1067 length:945 start_codon:yes stop_codon:yes gene_type:complete